jgi:hypothetical protein
VVALAAGATAGCMVPTRVAELDMKIPQNATPVAIQAGIEKMDDPVTQRRIQAMMARPEMRAVQRELVAGLVDGTLATLSEKERVERIEALTDKAMAGVLRQASYQLPAVAENASRHAVGGALDEALSPGRQEKLQATMHTLVATGMKSAAQGLREAEIGKTLSREMTDELGPAFQKSVRESVAPGAAEVLKNEELRRELGATARVLGREMVLGATEALNQQKEPADGSLLARLSAVAGQGAKLFGSAAWLLLLVIVALIVWIVKLVMQARQYRADAERRAATARLLEEVAKASKGKPWSDELLETVRHSLHDAEQLAEAEAAAKRSRRKSRSSLPVPPVPSEKMAQ